MPPTPHEIADQALADLVKLESEIAFAENDFKTRMAQILAESHLFIDMMQVRRKELIRGLKMLMKSETDALFDGRDLVDLPHGRLLHSREPMVSIPKNALIKIEEAGWAAEAIQVVKSVIRGVVEKWPDEKLAVIGAARKLVDSFTYELKP